MVLNVPVYLIIQHYHGMQGKQNVCICRCTDNKLSRSVFTECNATVVHVHVASANPQSTVHILFRVCSPLQLQIDSR